MGGRRKTSLTVAAYVLLLAFNVFVITTGITTAGKSLIERPKSSINHVTPAL